MLRSGVAPFAAAAMSTSIAPTATRSLSGSGRELSDASRLAVTICDGARASRSSICRSVPKPNPSSVSSIPSSPTAPPPPPGDVSSASKIASATSLDIIHSSGSRSSESPGGDVAVMIGPIVLPASSAARPLSSTGRARIIGVTTLASARIAGSTVTLSEPRTSGIESGVSARRSAAIAAPLAFSTDSSRRGKVPSSAIREPRVSSAPA